MTITKNKEGTRMTLALEGRLDTTTAPQLEAAVKTSLYDVTELVLDLEMLEYISSAGLRVILAAQKQMNKKNSPMVVMNANETVMEVFELTGFTDILTIQ